MSATWAEEEEEEERKRRERERARERGRRGDRHIKKESERDRGESWCAKRAQAREGLSRGIQPHFH